MIWDGFLLGIGIVLAILAVRLVGVLGVLLVLGVGHVLANYGVMLLMVLVWGLRLSSIPRQACGLPLFALARS